MIQNPLQNQSMRHTGLDPVSPASLEGFKINSVLIQSVQLCDSGSQPGMTKKELGCAVQGDK